MAEQKKTQKLNVKKTILTGFGFLATSIAWAIYDPYITKILNKILSESELVKACDAEGKICAAPTVSCPPAVPIVISGEKITKADIELFKFYGVDEIDIVKE